MVDGNLRCQETCVFKAIRQHGVVQADFDDFVEVGQDGVELGGQAPP